MDKIKTPVEVSKPNRFGSGNRYLKDAAGRVFCSGISEVDATQIAAALNEKEKEDV